MNFTLFLNSRKRIRLLDNFLFSVQQTTKDLNNIEILIRYDDDDHETEEYSTADFPFSVKFSKGQRLTNLIASFNEMARAAKGENLFVCNDDIQILTPGWDQIALEKISAYKKNNNIKDNIYYCRTDCNSIDRDQTKGYCSFPIISKECVNVLGFFMYDKFVGLGGDSSIYLLYNAIDRVIDIPEIKIDHILHRNLSLVHSPDETALQMRINTSNNFVDPYTFNIEKEVAILKKHISKY